MSAADAGGERPAEPPARQRLFFALWPDADVRAALAAVARGCGHGRERILVPANLHLTLAFVGNVTADQRACMEAAAATVNGRSFAVTLDQLGFWPRPRVLWAGVEAVPAALEELVADLNSALAICGYQPETRPFRAHVTLARKVSRPPRQIAIAPIRWTVRDFCLAQSVSGERGSEYRVLGRWPLRTGM